MTNDNKTRFTLRMPTTLYNEVQDLATEMGMTRNMLIVQVLRKNINKLKKEREVI